MICNAQFVRVLTGLFAPSTIYVNTIYVTHSTQRQRLSLVLHLCLDCESRQAATRQRITRFRPSRAVNNWLKDEACSNFSCFVEKWQTVGLEN